MTAVLKFAALCDGEVGGLTAGVHLADNHPSETDMRRLCAEAGCTQTAFAAPMAGGWRVRYCSPVGELPFGSQATIALGAALTRQLGDGAFALTLNDGRIFLEGHREGTQYATALQSPPTRSAPAPGPLVEAVLEIFDFGKVDLHKGIPAARANAGADHLVIGLASREALVAKHYGLAACRLLMTTAGLETIILAWPESAQRIHTRNPFAAPGFHDDPAIIASTAALAGHLRDQRWPHGGAIQVVQGTGSATQSTLHAEFTEERGSPIRVWGLARFLG